MTDRDPRSGDARRWGLPSWRRITDFLLTVAQLERSYESLKVENQGLRSRIAILEAEVADRSGQLKILAAFLQTAVKDFTNANMENAVARQIEKLTQGSLPRAGDR